MSSERGRPRRPGGPSKPRSGRPSGSDRPVGEGGGDRPRGDRRPARSRDDQRRDDRRSRPERPSGTGRDRSDRPTNRRSGDDRPDRRDRSSDGGRRDGAPSRDGSRGRPDRDGSRRGPTSGSGRSGWPSGEGRRSAPEGSRGRGRPGDGRGSSGRSGPQRPEEGQGTAGPKSWGSLGRKGAARIEPLEGGHRSFEPDPRPDPEHETARWERVEPERGERKPRGRTAPPPRGSDPAADLEPRERRGRPRRPAGSGTGGADAREELVRALGGARGKRANDRLRDAAHAFERERFEEARGLLKPIADVAPGATAVRELLGLTYYRLGRWKESIKELETFRELTGSVEQNPVLADAHRALGHHGTVEELWDELREVSPSAELVTEGRIVMGGSLADRGSLQDAIDLLEKSLRGQRKPRPDQLRQAYALADLYERAGEIARARELFHWIARLDPGFVDAAERAADLT